MSLRGVKQSVTGHSGNCTAACLATILDLPLEEVFDAAPYWAFGEEGLIPGWLMLQSWLERCHGAQLVQYSPGFLGDWRPDGYWIATTDEGGSLHATVWLRDQFVWNPDPDDDGPPRGPLVAVNFLVARDEEAA